MSNLSELRNWVVFELKQAEFNASRSLKEANDGFRHNHNAGRAAALRGVLEKIEMLVAQEAVPTESLLDSRG